MLRRLSAMLLLVLLAPAAARAQSGVVKEFGSMWTFDAPPLAHWKATHGFEPSQAWLDNVRLASVRIPGCSASLVSREGLLMTNHHCSRACITAVSPADTNYQDAGFVARNRADEKPCPEMYADQLQSIEDVTARVQAAVTSDDAAEAGRQRAAVFDEIRAECATGEDIVCEMVTLFNGGRYSLYRFRRYGEVKLVMAPEGSVSFFGGDPDNFTYPRYDLDMTFFRVYENGEPLQPRNYFRWSEHGAQEGDLVFVTGNPGSTGRLLTMAQMEYLRDVQYPAQLGLIERQIGAIRAHMGEDEQRRRQYEDQLFSLENAHKAISGYLTGLRDSTIMARKAAFEADFRARVQRDAALQRQYGAAWDRVAAAERARTELALRSQWYGFGGSQLLNVAGGIVRLPEQAALPDSARLPQYRGNSINAVRQQVLAPNAEYDLALEEGMLAAHLAAAAAALPAGDPYLAATLDGRTPEAAARALITGTRLTDPAVRQRLVEGGAAAVAASDDPLIRAARAINRIGTPVAGDVARQNAIIAASTERIGQAIFAAYGTSLPPDATFTLRISDGIVKGYTEGGTVVPFRTTFYGLYGRSAAFGNVEPWQLPARWQEREAALELATPYNFVSTNDIIGGNSGSPVINRDAEVVGLIFDGNMAMLPNRFIYTDEVARAVSVHSEGMIEALRKVYDAGWIADELEAR